MDEMKEKYLQGKLTEAEKIAFEENLSESERKELAYELGVKDEIEQQSRIELRQQVAGFEGSKEQRSNSSLFIRIAASVVLAGSLLFYLMQDQGSLFDAYYEVYPNYEVTTLRGETEMADRVLAYAAYDAGEYANAIQEFNKLDSLYSSDYFFRGISYVQIEEYETAILDFTSVREVENSIYEDAAIWYTALVFLKLDNKEKSIPLLQQLSSGNSEFASTASKLLSEL